MSESEKNNYKKKIRTRDHLQIKNAEKWDLQPVFSIY